MEYKTIADRCEARFIEKKSEFIGYLAPVAAEDEAIAFINEIRAMHRKATHNCYAYILRENSTARHSDDGEPSGTAGVPIYEVLRKEELCNVACVVTRYFGGIMLGAGGLVRAYTRGAKDAFTPSSEPEAASRIMFPPMSASSTNAIQCETACTYPAKPMPRRYPASGMSIWNPPNHRPQQTDCPTA